MNKATVSSKGQVTIPVAFRRKWNLHGMRQIEILQLPDGTVQLKPLRSLSELAGSLGAYARGPAPSIKKLRNVAAEGWIGKSERKPAR